MSKLTPRTRKILSCALLYLLSAALLTWRLWLTEYRAYAAFWDKDILYTTLVLEAFFTAIFLMLLYLRLPFLDVIGVFLKKHQLTTPLMTTLASVAILLLFAGIQALIDALPNDWGFGINCYAASMMLWLIYLQAKGVTPQNELRNALPYRLAVVPILVFLSKLVMNGFAPAFYMIITLSISDLISVTRSKGNEHRIRSALCILLPPILCFALILGAKAVFFPDVLDFQIRTIYGTANSYSLGEYINCLRESGKLPLYGSCYMLALVAGTFLLYRLSTRSEDSYRIILLGISACFFAFSGLLQAFLNAVLTTRLMPFQWLISGGLVCLLANSIVHSETYLTNKNDKEVS